ncbi:MAG: MmgE/PrpD family protein [Gammaproteobacteria bacterium]
MGQQVAGAALADLAARLAAVTFDSIGAAAQMAARQRLLDTLAAAALGQHTQEGRLLGRFAEGNGGAVCRLLTGAARSTEVDDIDLPGCTTVGAVIVPVAVTVAAARPALAAGALLSAVVSGYEAMTRLGRAIGGATLLYRGVWPTYVTAAFGAAATTARLLELDAATTARALALALTRTANVPAAALTRFGYRYYVLGCAAADGCDAALAAAAGVDADLGGLVAFGERLGAAVDLAELAVQFGAPWRVASVDTKPWPTSRQALASVAAFRQLELPPLAEIERIVVSVPLVYRGMIDRPSPPGNRIESMVGVQYQLALAAFAPATLDDALRESLPHDTRIAALMQKVQVRGDDGLGAQFPRSWGSRVTLDPRAGAPTTIEVLAPPGSGTRALAWSELMTKLGRVFTASGLSVDPRIAALATRCERLGTGEGNDAARELLELTAELARS